MFWDHDGLGMENVDTSSVPCSRLHAVSVLCTHVCQASVTASCARALYTVYIERDAYCFLFRWGLAVLQGFCRGEERERWANVLHV